MFPWLPYALGIYFLVLLVGLVLCFVTRRGPKRRNIRIGTVIFSIPLWLMVAGCIWVWYQFLREPPTLAELQRRFPSERADLETILRMSNEDADYSRIALDFLDRTADKPNESGRYMESDPKSTLPKARWDEYRKIYKRNGIELGIQRDSNHDAFIMVRSVGFLDQGHISGYLYCAASPVDDTYRYEPCSLKQDSGEQKYTGGQKAYSFRRIDQRWFAFDEGPW